MYCIKCGTKIEEINKYCPNCGNKQRNKENKDPYKTPFIMTSIVLASLILSFLAFFIIIIISSITDENSQNINFIQGYASLSYNEKQITFQVPYGYEIEPDESTEDDQTFYNINGDFINYYLDYNYDHYYDIQKIKQQKYYSKDHKKAEMHEYNTKINNKNINVFYIDYITNEGEKYRDTFAYYPISNDYIVQITISVNGVNKNNINKYIKTENNFSHKI